MRKRLRRTAGNTGGTTLVELIVTFALIGIFLASAAMVMGSYFKIFIRAREYGNQQTLAATLADTIELELGAAEAGTYKYQASAEAAEEERKGVTIASGGKKIYYKNQDNIPIEISMDADGHLQILYYTQENQGGTVVYNDLDWYYGEGVYNNNKITTLLFEPFTTDSGKTNYVKLTLELENELEDGITYETSRIIRCYNLKGDSNEENNVHY